MINKRIEIFRFFLYFLSDIFQFPDVNFRLIIRIIYIIKIVRKKCFSGRKYVNFSTKRMYCVNRYYCTVGFIKLFPSFIPFAQTNAHFI